MTSKLDNNFNYLTSDGGELAGVSDIEAVLTLKVWQGLEGRSCSKVEICSKVASTGSRDCSSTAAGRAQSGSVLLEEFVPSPDERYVTGRQDGDLAAV